MSYKYHERAQVFNERNMVRVWDVAFDGYNGGMGSDFLEWGDLDKFTRDTDNFTTPYDGVSFVAMSFPSEGPVDKLSVKQLPNPLVWYDDYSGTDAKAICTDPEGIHQVSTANMRLTSLLGDYQTEIYTKYKDLLPDFAGMDLRRKLAGTSSMENECSPAGSLAFQGSMRVVDTETGRVVDEVQGSGHLGHSYVGVAAVREGKGHDLEVAPHAAAGRGGLAGDGRVGLALARDAVALLRELPALEALLQVVALLADLLELRHVRDVLLGGAAHDLVEPRVLGGGLGEL
eukprot:2977436-Rhodomonas_salina.1